MLKPPPPDEVDPPEPGCDPSSSFAGGASPVGAMGGGGAVFALPDGESLSPPPHAARIKAANIRIAFFMMSPFGLLHFAVGAESQFA